MSNIHIAVNWQPCQKVFIALVVKCQVKFEFRIARMQTGEKCLHMRKHMYIIPAKNYFICLYKNIVIIVSSSVSVSVKPVNYYLTITRRLELVFISSIRKFGIDY